MSKIKVHMCELYNVLITKEWVEVDSESYEDTKGMTPKELQIYIEENYNKMITNNKGQINSLGDELNNMVTISIKNKKNDMWLRFKSSDE
jgi:hypothetical protein